MSSSSWHSYPSVYNLRHRYVESLLTVPVDVEEKVDGSQFSFGMIYDPASEGYRLRVRSKGAEMLVDAPQQMFGSAVAAVRAKTALLKEGWTYRGEILCKPKHNALAYDRVPTKNFILFDVNTGEEHYLSHEEKKTEAERIGFECVPLLYRGMVESPEKLRSFLAMQSVLGGQTVEGVVIKPTNRDLFGQDKKLLIGKFVSEAFKEVHAKAWSRGGEFKNHTQNDIIARLGEKYRSEARWRKAVQHLSDGGQLEDSPCDIALLIREVPEDIMKECQDDIAEELMTWAMRDLRKQWARGLAEWYKNYLLEKQFEMTVGCPGEVAGDSEGA